jgi:ubiquinol-cytochrome c reductase cytochrome c1 subunit
MRKHLLTAALLTASVALAGHEGKPLKKVDWSFSKVTGTFDKAAAQRGLLVYQQVCSTCHSMNLLRYGTLTGLGLTMDEAKAVAAQYKVPGIDDDGNPKERKALISDHFAKPYANDKMARAANNGALPPDLSLIIKARPGGANYTYSLLTGYTTPPEGTQLGPNMHWNDYFPDHQISMTSPLHSDNLVTYPDGTKATVDQMAKDVVTFLAWAAEPEMEQRKGMGIKVMFYLLLMTLVFYLAKRKIWRDVH